MADEILTKNPPKTKPVLTADSPLGPRPIPGYEGLYWIDEHGVVSKPDGTTMKWSKPRNTREYPAVNLRSGNGRKRVSVHRLVAITFWGAPPHEKSEVRHMDGNHINPFYGNLRWGTSKENAEDRRRHGTIAQGSRHGLFGKGIPGERNGISKLTESDVRQIRSMAGNVMQKDIASKFGVHKAVIWRIINHKAWTHV